MEQNNKPKTQLKFKITANLTAISFIAKKTDKSITKKHTSKIKKKVSHYDRMFADIKEVAVGYIFPIQDNSIAQLLNSCHKDVKDFIHNNEISQINAGCNGLVITTKNKFRVNIKTLGTNKREIIITDRKRKVMLRTETFAIVEQIKHK